MCECEKGESEPLFYLAQGILGMHFFEEVQSSHIIAIQLCCSSRFQPLVKVGFVENMIFILWKKRESKKNKTPAVNIPTHTDEE